MSYARELNKGMKVFSQLYVGMKEQGNDQPLLGFATPYEENSAGLKRQDTIKRWIGMTRPIIVDGRYSYNENGNIIYEPVKQDIRIIDNKPRGGFKITDDIKRTYWGGGNVVFRVYDPEGFELEIQSQNLMAIIQVAGINEGGVIPGYCLWGRDGKDNILLHERSEEYKNAILAAETLKKPKEVGTGSRVRGSKYLLQDTSEGTYLGQFWVCVEGNKEEHSYRTVAKVGDITAHAEAQKNVRSALDPVKFDAVLFGDEKDGYIKLYKKAPLVRVIDAAEMEMDLDSALTIIKGTESVAFASASLYGRVCYIHHKKPGNLKYVVNQLSLKDFEKTLKNLKTRNERYFQGQGQKRSVADFHAFYGGSGPSGKIKAIKIACGIHGNSADLAVFNPKVPHYDSYVGGYPKSAISAVLPISMEGSTLVEYKVDQYRGARSYIYGVPLNAPTVDAAPLPMFENVEDMANWYQEQFDLGNLLEINVCEV